MAPTRKRKTSGSNNNNTATTTTTTTGSAGSASAGSEKRGVGRPPSSSYRNSNHSSNKAGYASSTGSSSNDSSSSNDNNSDNDKKLTRIGGGSSNKALNHSLNSSNTHSSVAGSRAVHSDSSRGGASGRKQSKQGLWLQQQQLREQLALALPVKSGRMTNNSISADNFYSYPFASIVDDAKNAKGAAAKNHNNNNRRNNNNNNNHDSNLNHSDSESSISESSSIIGGGETSGNIKNDNGNSISRRSSSSSTYSAPKKKPAASEKSKSRKQNRSNASGNQVSSKASINNETNRARGGDSEEDQNYPDRGQSFNSVPVNDGRSQANRENGSNSSDIESTILSSSVQGNGPDVARLKEASEEDPIFRIKRKELVRENENGKKQRDEEDTNGDMEEDMDDNSVDNEFKYNDQDDGINEELNANDYDGNGDDEGSNSGHQNAQLRMNLAQQPTKKLPPQKKQNFSGSHHHGGIINNRMSYESSRRNNSITGNSQDYGAASSNTYDGDVNTNPSKKLNMNPAVIPFGSGFIGLSSTSSSSNNEALTDIEGDVGDDEDAFQYPGESMDYSNGVLTPVDGVVNGSIANKDSDEQERLRKSAFKELSEIEAELVRFKNKYYEEKSLEIDVEIKTVHDGSHSQIATITADIEQRKVDFDKQSIERLRVMNERYALEYETAVEIANLEFLRKKAEARSQLMEDAVKNCSLLTEEMRRYHMPHRDRGVSHKRRKTRRNDWLEWKNIMEDYDYDDDVCEFQRNSLTPYSAADASEFHDLKSFRLEKITVRRKRQAYQYFPSGFLSGLSAQRIEEDLELLK